MAISERALELVRDHPEWLPLLPLHGWKSAPGEGGPTHCESCRRAIGRGDPAVGTCLESASVVFCPECVSEATGVFREWLAHGRG